MVWMKQCRPANLSIVLGLAFVLVLVHYTLYTEIHASRIERISLRLLLRTSILAAIRGGNEVVRARQENLNVRSKGLNQLGKDDPLTDGDMRSHRVMLKTLFKIFPRLVVVSEEHEDDDGDVVVDNSHNGKKKPSQSTGSVLDDVNLPESISNFVDETVRLRDVLVWIDPLDATQEYTEGLTEFVTTMVCIAVKGHARIGVIHQPFANRTVWAWVGQGPSKSLRGSPIDGSSSSSNNNNVNNMNINNNNNNNNINNVDNINNNINVNNNNDNNNIDMSDNTRMLDKTNSNNNNNNHNNKDINNANNDHDNNMNHLAAENDKIDIVVSRSHAGKVKQFARENLSGEITVISAGGAGYKALQVAEGKADLYMHTTLIKKWDICAGSALLEALGGQMVTLKGESIDFGSPRSEKNPDGLLAFVNDKSDFMRLTRVPLPN